MTAERLGLLLALFLSASCSSDDGATVVRPDRGGDTDAADDDAGDAVDAAEDTAAPPDTAGDTGGTACTSGRRECVGTLARRECLPDGTWLVSECDEGRACEDGACVLIDASVCTDGERGCLAGEVAVCASGEWVAVSACDEGLACANGTCVTPECASAARAGSYLGCEYVASPLPNLAWGIGGTPTSPVGIVLTNADADEPVSVWVYEADGETLAGLVGEVTINPTLSAGGDVSPVTVQSEILNRRRDQVDVGMTVANGISIPAAGIGIFLVPHLGNPGGTTVRPTSYVVRTDRPVAAYQFSPYCCNFSFTNDASLLYPTAALGREYMYLGTPTWLHTGDGTGAAGRYSAIMSIVGARPATTVTVDLPDGVAIAPPSGADASLTGSRLTATLDLGDVLHVYGLAPGSDGVVTGTADLSGARIASTQPVAVFSGHECTYYPWDRAACDHLEEQLLPIDTWGTEFVLAPPRFRSTNLDATTETLYWKVQALHDGTEITLGAAWSSLAATRPGFGEVPFCGDAVTGSATLALDAGEYCEFGTRRAFTAVASGPIQILGIISGADTVGFGATQAGDPAIFAVPPRRQFRTEYAFIAPTTYARDYVTVVAPSRAAVLLDGRPLDLAGGASIAGSGDVYLSVPIDDGAHRIVGDLPFGILVYAYDDWVSYAFTGGMNLVKE